MTRLRAIAILWLRRWLRLARDLWRFHPAAWGDFILSRATALRPPPRPPSPRSAPRQFREPSA